jgi:hypothetical protein
MLDNSEYGRLRRWLRRASRRAWQGEPQQAELVQATEVAQQMAAERPSVTAWGSRGFYDVTPWAGAGPDGMDDITGNSNARRP